MNKLFFATLTLLALAACKKIINVDLKEAAPQLVIEGQVSNSTAAQVAITKSVTFSGSNNFPTVSGASVLITDTTLGTHYPLSETEPGVYTNLGLIGTPQHTYKLSVATAGNTYTAFSTMPTQVNLDTLLFEQFAFASKFIWSVKPKYTDPAGFGNYYHFIEYINNVRNPTIWTWDDKFSNNGISTRPLIQSDSTINLNDSIEVEMRCIDKNMYRYIKTLQDLQQNSATPSNPSSNISGNVLGYFSAFTQQRKKLPVKP